VVERSIYRHDSSERPLDDILLDPFAQVETTPAPVTEGGDLDRAALPLDLKQWLEQHERLWVERALRQAHYNQRQAAELLSLTYHQLRGVMKKHAIRIGGDDGY